LILALIDVNFTKKCYDILTNKLLFHLILYVFCSNFIYLLILLFLLNWQLIALKYISSVK